MAVRSLGCVAVT
jgi:hypothetical protein